MLVDELGVTVPAQQQAEVVKPGDNALQLDAVDQKNRQRRLGFANVIEKCVLDFERDR